MVESGAGVCSFDSRGKDRVQGLRACGPPYSKSENVVTRTLRGGGWVICVRYCPLFCTVLCVRFSMYISCFCFFAGYFILAYIFFRLLSLESNVFFGFKKKMFLVFF